MVDPQQLELQFNGTREMGNHSVKFGFTGEIVRTTPRPPSAASLFVCTRSSIAFVATTASVVFRRD